jgi:hypothetical protein
LRIVAPFIEHALNPPKRLFDDDLAMPQGDGHHLGAAAY